MSNRIEGERVFCHACENEWDRAHGGLQCPRCEGEFVEILENGRRPDIDDPPEVTPDSPTDFDEPSPMRSLRNHNPWAPDPDEGDIRTIHFNTGGGLPGTSGFSFTRTYTFGGDRPTGMRDQNFNPQNYHDAASAEVMRNFESMFTGILGSPARVRGSTFGGQININGRTTTFGSGIHDTDMPPSGMAGHDLMSILFPGQGARGPRSPGSPLDLFSQLLNPANARSGDHVWSQEAFDRVMSQLMEQNQQNGAPPASEDRINSLPKKNIDKSMLGNDGKAECSICMEGVELGTEVTTLPCQHWFHFECIKSWLSEHDTCPHCRKPITPEDEQRNRRTPESGRRRSSRRSSSVASPLTQVRSGGLADATREGSRQNPIPIPDVPSPSAIRSAREQYYAGSASMRQRQPEDEREPRPSSERRSSRRSTGSGGGRDEGGGGTGVTGWLRNRMNF